MDPDLLQTSSIWQKLLYFNYAKKGFENSPSCTSTGKGRERMSSSPPCVEKREQKKLMRISQASGEEYICYMSTGFNYKAMKYNF